MPFAEHDHVVQAFLTNAPDHPLRIRILPRPPRRSQHLRQAQTRDASVKDFAIDRIPVSEEVLRNRVPGNGRDELLAVHRAVGCSVTWKCTTLHRAWAKITSTKSTVKSTVGTVKKSRATHSIIGCFTKAREAGENGRRGHRRYVSRPWTSRRQSPASAIHPASAPPPAGISRRDVSDPFPEFAAACRPARVSSVAASPVVPKAPPLPGTNGWRLHEDQDLPPARPPAGQPRPEEAVGWAHLRPPDRSLVERPWVAPRADLPLQGQARAEETCDEREQGTHEGHHDVESFEPNQALSEACRVMQFGEKVSRDADYAYSGTTGHHPPKMKTLRKVSHAVAPSPTSIALTSKSAFSQQAGELIRAEGTADGVLADDRRSPSL